MIAQMTNEEILKQIQAEEDVSACLAGLYKKNLALLRKLAGPFAMYHPQELPDLLQEGFLALYMAAQRYEPERGGRFLTYAEYWIKSFMIRYIKREPNNISLNTPIGDEGDQSLEDFIPDPEDKIGDMLNKTARGRAARSLWEAVDELEYKESAVIKASYRGQQTPKAIGKHQHETEQEIRRLKRSALNKLRKSRKVKAAAREMGLLPWAN